LRYHSPCFDELALDVRAGLIEETCSHINEFVEDLHKLMSFLEHSKPKRRGSVASRDIKAAVLKELDGLTSRQITEVLCMNLPASSSIMVTGPLAWL
jgi:hypothetical protein